MKSRSSLTVGTLLLAAAVLSCSKQQGNSAEPRTTAGSSTVNLDAATAATITGVIHFTGTVPKPRLIDMAQDPDCHGENVDEAIVSREGRLANVLVYVKDGLPKNRDWIEVSSSQQDAFDATEAQIHQRGCRYDPHVVAILASGKISVFNNDNTIHNVHAVAHANREWNVSQISGAEVLVKTFSQPELMIPVRCNVHPWMRAYINVMDNPFFSVTQGDGSFSLAGLPPGTYTIAALHETLGEQTATVTVGAKEKKVADFTFNGPINTASGAR